MEGFYTISKTAAAEQVIQKSRFLALAANISSPQEAEKHRARVQEEFPNARHYVYAYRLFEGRLEKSSDDGEPQGTGGRPVLDILQHRDLWNIQIIVVRYFGGILLGTGGLTRAYGSSARLVLDQAEITELLPHCSYYLTIPYSWYEPIKYQLRKNGREICQELFTGEVKLKTYIPKEDASNFEKWLKEYTNDQVSYEILETILLPVRGCN